MINIMALEVSANASKWGDAWNGNRLELAGQVTFIGMLMVFLVLACLWLVLAVFKLIFAKKPSVKAEKTEKIAKESKAESAPAPIAPTAPVAVASDDAELIAVITAAVAAYRAAEDPTATPTGFRVVSYRRTNGGRAWNAK